MASDAESLPILCDVCEDTFSRMLDSSEDEFVHQASHANLARSAAEDCMICSDIIDDIAQSNHRFGLHPPRPLTSWLLDTRKDRKKAMEVNVWLTHCDLTGCTACDSEYPQHFVKTYDFTPVISHARSGDNRERQFPTVFSNCTGSAETRSRITTWIEQCTDTHDICKEGQEVAWLPSRLLEISDVRGDLYLRLRDRSELQSGRYCTLSHRWGASGSKSLQLNADSLSSFRNGIAVSILKPAFRDMVDLTWRLGLRLIWIDCMCIIQDNSQDWRDESALMGKVYANSWLNVSANAKKASRAGLYAARCVSRNLARFCAQYDESGEVTIWTVTAQFEWSEEVEEAPVNTRAWVLQERILSPRIVHMSSNQVYWECRQLQASEHFPHGEPTYEELANSQLKRICYGNQEEDKDDVLMRWQLLVSKYTSCDLTFETDRLIALSGIASMVHKRTQCDYLAGIWRKYLPIDLLWSVWWPATNERVAKTMMNANGSPRYVAPSWSWASGIRHVVQPKITGRFRTYATVQRCETSLANPTDRFGAVLAGVMELRAPLGTLDWIGTHDSKNRVMRGYHVTDIKISIPLESERTETVAHLEFIHSIKKLLLLDREEYLDLHTAYFAVIRTQLEASHRDPESNTWYLGYNVEGLLLKRLPCSRYVRIGVALLEFETEQDFVSKMPEQDVIII